MIGELLALGVIVYWLSGDGDVKHLEENFADTYGSKYANQVIPTDFAFLLQNDPKVVSKLCRQGVIKRSLALSRPKVETHDIHFKEIHRPPMIAEVVRCSRNTAIIQAPPHNGNGCAYLLQLYRRGRKGNSYHIHRKFCYIQNRVKQIKGS